MGMIPTSLGRWLSDGEPISPTPKRLADTPHQRAGLRCVDARKNERRMRGSRLTLASSAPLSVVGGFSRGKRGVGSRIRGGDIGECRTGRGALGGGEGEGRGASGRGDGSRARRVAKTPGAVIPPCSSTRNSWFGASRMTWRSSFAHWPTPSRRAWTTSPTNCGDPCHQSPSISPRARTSSVPWRKRRSIASQGARRGRPPRCSRRSVRCPLRLWSVELSGALVRGHCANDTPDPRDAEEAMTPGAEPARKTPRPFGPRPSPVALRPQPFARAHASLSGQSARRLHPRHFPARSWLRWIVPVISASRMRSVVSSTLSRNLSSNSTSKVRSGYWR